MSRRTASWPEAARARGRKGGSRHKLDDKKRAMAIDLYRQKNHTVGEICRMVGISKPTLYSYVRQTAAGSK
jgi:transposase-like protein